MIDWINVMSPITVRTNAAKAIVCIQGRGSVSGEPVGMGDTILIPACLGGYEIIPDGSMRVLECGVV